MKYRLPLACLVLGGAMLRAAPVWATTYSFTTIDEPAATAGTEIYGINDSGQLVGKYSDTDGTHGFVDTDGHFTIISGPGSAYTAATGINDSGQIVGTYEGYFSLFGFEQTGGTLTTFFVPSNSFGGVYTFPQGINSAGVIVGFYNRIDGSYGFEGTPGNFTTIEDPAGTNTMATGINAAGQIVGSYEVGSGPVFRSFVETNGIFTLIHSPVFSGSVFAQGINDLGQVVGTFYDNGFVDTDGNVTVLNDPDATAGGTMPEGINDAGQIVGYYYNGTGDHGFIASPVATVPEPGSLLLTGTAVAGLRLLGRRRPQRAGFSETR